MFVNYALVHGMIWICQWSQAQFSLVINVTGTLKCNEKVDEFSSFSFLLETSNQLVLICNLDVLVDVAALSPGESIGGYLFLMGNTWGECEFLKAFLSNEDVCYPAFSLVLLLEAVCAVLAYMHLWREGTEQS